MRTIYVDSNFVCHTQNMEGMTAVETDALDHVCDSALEFYKFFPAHEGKVDMIQCFDSRAADAVQKAVDRVTAEKDAEITEINEAMMDFVAMVEEA